MQAVAGIVGQAELLCVALAVPSLLLYFGACALDHASAAPAPGGARGRGGALGHWARVAGAVVCMLAAALCKEIGITAAGCMLAYDTLLVPLVGGGEGRAAAGGEGPAGASVGPAAAGKDAGGKAPPASSSSAANGAHGVGGKAAPAASAGPVASSAGKAGRGGTAEGASAAAAGPGHASGMGKGRGGGGAAVAAALGALLGQRKWRRMAAPALAVLLYVRARSLVAGDQLVRIYRKVRATADVVFDLAPQRRFGSAGETARANDA